MKDNFSMEAKWKVENTWYRGNLITEALRYGKHCPGTATQTLVHEWIPAFAFPAEAGPHLPILEGWKAEFA